MKVLMRQVILHVSLKLLVDFNFSSVGLVSLFLFAMIALFSVVLNSTYELCTVAT